MNVNVSVNIVFKVKSFVVINVKVKSKVKVKAMVNVNKKVTNVIKVKTRFIQGQGRLYKAKV